MASSWGKWEEGSNGIAVRVELPKADTYPDDFKCRVEIRDSAGEVHARKGRGSFIGNFSPIWVTWNNKRRQLTEILR